MNEEIKEILDSWKLGIEKGIDKNGIYVGGLCYSWEQLSLLLDYITNLQQENEILKQSDKNTYETSQEMLAEMQQAKDKLQKDYQEAVDKIEELKLLCDKYEEEHNTTFKTWQEAIKENERLKEERERLLYNLEKVCEEDNG